MLLLTDNCSEISPQVPSINIQLRSVSSEPPITITPSIMTAHMAKYVEVRKICAYDASTINNQNYHSSTYPLT